MDRRLPPNDGEWIDRDRPVEFRFEGQTYHGYAGDVLSSALWANDVRLLGRSFKYHRPRGIYSLANHDVSLMVEDGQRTNLRGDVLAIEPGMDLRAVNTAGGVQRDRLRIISYFSRFMPVGFYYKAFHTPRLLFPFYENKMRKVAGLGKINPSARSGPSPKDYAFCDLLVVGAGPAGLSGAVAAAQQGLDVLLVDENPRPGGSFAWQWARDPSAQQKFRELLSQVNALDNLKLRCGTQAAGWYSDHWIALCDEDRLTKLRSQTMLVAGGCFEQPAVFQNNDLPGVMLGSAAARLMHLYSAKPFDRVVVLAANSDAYRIALDLREAGVEVAAIVDLRHEGENSELAERVAAAGIETKIGHAIYEAIPAAGKTRVSSVIVGALENSGTVAKHNRQQYECDGIVMSVGWAPNAGLVYQAGGRFRYAEHVEQFVPHQLPERVYVAGRANGVFDLDSQIEDGRRAGLAAAAELGRFDGPIPPAPAHQAAPPSHAYPIVSHPGKKNFVDLDEDLHLADFVNAHQEGYDNIELVKRYTTVGMGPSQGKLSNTNAVRILARLNNATINETGTTTSRPFYHPVSLNHLAGRRFHPQRRTPIHNWHVDAEACLMHAGAWLRPEYYTVSGKSREESIFAEALNVRENVGLIDVSTLGKIQVRGPDAIRFLERIYTGRFAKQPVGQLRYGVACDETGIIIEDGIIVRRAEDSFYVTATSSGAAAFYRDLQRWKILFGMDVVLVNVTGHFAAMNIAGPKSRDVLSKLTDVDLTSESFPYLRVREGTVAGAQAILIRIGFVGELGYEIHVPSSCGLHVWQSLIDVGRDHQIQPFGVEAQRLLRLEKGHLIVGQDTDALTNPYEANVEWTIGKKRSPFVGSRSLEIVRKKPLTRRQVGIAMSSEYHGPIPKECNLIITDGDITGRITSVAAHSTVGHPIALAFIRPDLAEVGTKIQIRIDKGALVDAEVTSLPFYDPDNQRQ